ncbi:MAG: aldolase/citrate lyase family protein [Dysosmobacter sp.]|nr:aldolase/citrate lyase family protein [Dysosmobacter sp.]MDY3867581.1 aldolase/citrate lyase family protein [Dysosmobacter sp.]
MIPFQTLLAENAPFLGTFVQSAAPEFLEASAYAGFRFAAIDLEHTYYGVEKMAELIRAGEAAGLSMLARVPTLDAVWIKKSLDFGAAGVIVPNIDTPEQAAQAVALCKFTPEGIRGACSGVRANRYGAGGSEYYAEANRRTAVIPLVESSEGAANFEKILRTPGITAVFLGPVDLSVAMGLKGNVNAPEVRSALLTMVEQANRAGIPVGALGLDPTFVRELFSRGLNFLAYGIDTILMYQKCCEIQQAVFGRSAQ